MMAVGKNVTAPISTPAQRQAIEHPLAPLLIVAGAGTGKTYTLVQRIAAFIEAHGIGEERILALTFSEHAAAELKGRIREASGKSGEISAMTFHAFCYQTVLEFLPEYRQRRLMTNGDIIFLLREHFAELPDLMSEQFRREPSAAFKAFRSFFNRLRDELITPPRFPALLEETARQWESDAADGWDEALAQLQDHCAVYPHYQRWKAADGWIDYGDMILACWELLSNNSEARTTLQERYDAVVIDEFQDNNYALNEVLEWVSKPHLNITAVGDDDQAIFGFRGASAYNLRDFEERYGSHAEFRQILLEENHRSVQPILDLANEAIRTAPGRHPKTLKSAIPLKDASKPALIVGSPAAQLQYIAGDITHLLATGKVRHKDIAILVRTNNHAREVIEGLSSFEIPARNASIRFFRLPAIRDALAWCSVVADSPGAHAGLYRLLQQAGRLESDIPLGTAMDAIKGGGVARIGVAPTLAKVIADIDTLKERARELSLPKLMREILTKSKLYRRHMEAGYYEDQLAYENLSLLLEQADDFAGRYQNSTLAQFLSYLGILSATEDFKGRLPVEGPGTGTINVLTVHAAKGREFPVVYMPFLQSARFPINHRPDKEVTTPPPSWLPWEAPVKLEPKDAHTEEERRLFYVGLTRAERQLTLLTTPKRQSPFIRNLPGELMEQRVLPDSDAEAAHEGDDLRQDLKRRLARELGRKAYPKAHELVDALRLVDDYESGQKNPDFENHPLADELRQALAPDGAVMKPVPDQATMTLSASALSSYDTCPLQYKYKYHDHIPDQSGTKAAFGKIVHTALEHLHRPDGDGLGQPLDALLDTVWESEGFTFRQEEAQYRQDADQILDAYVKRWKDNPPSVLEVEHKFDLNLGEITIKGRIDRIDKSDDGHITLVDYKTSINKWTENKARNDPQLALYALYMQATDLFKGQALEVDTTTIDLTYYFLRSEDPEVTITVNLDDLGEFKERILSIAAAIRGGVFEYSKGYYCDYCDYKELICPAWEQGQG